MFNRETTKGMTDAEFAEEIYIGLLDMPTECLQDLFEKTRELIKDRLSESGCEYLEAIKDYVINRRMQEAIN